MAKLSVLAGATSQSVNLEILNSTSTTGAGLTGLVFNSAGLTAYYTFVGANAGSTAITLATLAAVNSAYSSGGFKEIDATNMPGLYRLDIPNAAIAASKGRSVVIILRGATNMVDCRLEIELTGWDNQDAVHGGMSALPNTAVATNGSLITAGTGTSQLSVSGGVGQADAAKINGVSTSSVTAVNANQGTTQPLNFTGTAGAALVKSDMIDAASVAVTLDSNNVLNVSTKYIGGTLQTAKDVGGAVPAVAAGASGGLLISGANTGTTTLGALTVTGTLTVSDGVAVTRSTGNSDAVSLAGSGTGAGLKVRSGAGATGNGLDVAALSTNGHAVNLTGNGSGDGLKAAGGATGNGVEAIGGGTSGDGLKASTAGSGVPIRGDLTGNIHGTLDTLTTYTGNTPQTGDVYAQLPTRFSLLSIDASGRIDLGSIRGTASAGAAGYVGVDWSALLNKTAVVALTSTTVATATNLTNAPTSGDFTAAMKASLNASTPASVTTVTGNVDGSVGSVVAGVTVTGSVDVGSVNGHSTAGVTTIAAVWGTSVAPLFTGQLQQVDVRDWNGAAVAAPNVAGVPLMDVGYFRGTASAGDAGYAGLDWGHMTGKTATNALTGTTISSSQIVASVTAPVSVGNVTVGGYAAGQDPFTLVTTTPMAETTPALHATMTLAQVAYELRAQMGGKSVSGTTLTLKKLDGTTTYETYTLDSATAPTSITRTA